jgi:hypothetical protein
MSEREAEVLLFLSQRIGGDSEYSPRAVTARLQKALREVGIVDVKLIPSPTMGSNSIYFTNMDKKWGV